MTWIVLIYIHPYPDAPPYHWVYTYTFLPALGPHTHTHTHSWTHTVRSTQSQRDAMAEASCPLSLCLANMSHIDINILMMHKWAQSRTLHDVQWEQATSVFSLLSFESIYTDLRLSGDQSHQFVRFFICNWCPEIYSLPLTLVPSISP